MLGFCGKMRVGRTAFLLLSLVKKMYDYELLGV
jgi:hypothetical protein